MVEAVMVLVIQDPTAFRYQVQIEFHDQARTGLYSLSSIVKIITS